MKRGIYLLEEVEFRPMNSRRPLEYLRWLTGYKREDERRDDAAIEPGMSIRARELELVGAFYAVGVTGHQQFKAVTLWECHGGWDGGWRMMMEIYDPPREDLFLSAIDDLRWSAFSRPLAAVPGCPSFADLNTAGFTRPFFMLEVGDVRPGAALDYLAAVREQRVPVMADHGYTLAGLYEVPFTDNEVCTLWACDLDAFTAYQRSYDAALGMDDETAGDERLLTWRKTARTFLDGPWRETYLAPFPGTRLAPR